jgi:hypothetical protein
MTSIIATGLNETPCLILNWEIVVEVPGYCRHHPGGHSLSMYAIERWPCILDWEAFSNWDVEVMVC